MVPANGSRSAILTYVVEVAKQIRLRSAAVAAGLLLGILPLAAAASHAASLPRGAALPILSAQAPSALQQRGSAVAISGSIAVVGANVAYNGRGAAYVYVQTRSGWHLRATLHDPPGDGQAEFGSAVAVSGRTVLIGAPSAKVYIGAVYVYVSSGSGWHHQATLHAPAGTGSYFGTSVALSGSTAVIGGGGAAYIFARSGAVWSLRASLADPGASTDDLFGYSVALTSGTALVSASGANHNNGAAYVYAHSQSGWHLQLTINGRRGRYVTSGVAISPSTLVIGGGGAYGDVYLYARSGSSWRRQATLTDPSRKVGTLFGESAAVSGARLVVGAPLFHNACGVAFEFIRSAGRWHERAVIKDPRRSCRGSYFGWVLALSGRTSLIGAPFQDQNRGVVYLLRLI